MPNPSMNYPIDPTLPPASIHAVDPKDFRTFLILAIQLLRRPLGLNLHLHSEEEYAEMDLYLTNDRQSGFAVQRDGSLVNLFSLPKGRGPELIEAAKAAGATKLDAYDGYLPTFYARHGFAEVGRDKWDDQYAPSGWDYARGGRPDVVYMELRMSQRNQ